jgi:hypothetical protein
MEAGFLSLRGWLFYIEICRGLWFEEGEGVLKLLVSKFYGQATKGTRWMPWHFEAKKDVASCEKPR